jgi:hypothetical protein
MNATPDTSTPPKTLPIRSKLSEVKYALPEMLEEIKAERAASSFAMEQLDQHEIGKIFKSKAARAKSKK